jgi:hypothetical protein
VKSFLIRRAKVGDAAALRALNHQFNADETPLRWVEERLSEANPVEHVFVAIETNEIIGYCCVTIVSSFCRENQELKLRSSLWLGHTGEKVWPKN